MTMLIAIEELLVEQHKTASWRHILNNTTSTRPQSDGGPTCTSIQALLLTISSPSGFACTMTMPSSFQHGDGEFTVNVEAPSRHVAEEAACRRDWLTSS